MDSAAILTRFASASTQQLIAYGLGLVAVLLVGQVVLAIPKLQYYLSFYRDHEGFWRKSNSSRFNVVPFKAPWPGTPNTQYFLLTSKFSRAMFSNTPKLDHRDSIEDMHDLVWDVPKYEGREITRQCEKMVSRGLVKTKISGMTARVIEDVARWRESIGSKGARVPFAHRTWSLLWNCSVGGLFGEGLDTTSVREPARQMMHNANVCYLIELLPILPRKFWYAVLPKARAFRAGRTDLHRLCSAWVRDAAAVEAAEPMMQEIGRYLRKNEDQCSNKIAGAFLAMFLTGLAVNTGEVTGWMFSYLLQSPALLKAIVEEVDNLPAGRLDGLDLKALAPLLSSTIQETLRVRGSIFSGRTVKQPFTLPGHPHEFKPGELLRVMSPGVRLDTEAWGDDALSFKGHRFHEGGDAMYNAQLAFGGGATACPGRFLATQELLIVTAHLIRNFEFSDLKLHAKLPDTGDDMKCGAPLPAGTGTKETIIDLDGKVYEVHVPDQENEGCEIPSGVLPPLHEPTIFMKPRDVEA
ncbi:hypothetical protein JCM10449v2_000055 [Rhodotorula kratochvilovae]